MLLFHQVCSPEGLANSCLNLQPHLATHPSMWRFAGKEWNLLMKKQLETPYFQVNDKEAKEDGICLTIKATNQMTEI